MEEQDSSNPVMFVIIMALALVGIGLMASQTWLFIDWLMGPTNNSNIVMKVLTLTMFDIAALVWTAIDLFHVPPTLNAYYMVKSAMWVDFILASITTVFYCVIAYVLRFSVRFDLAGLAILMECAVTFATVFNCVLFVLYGHAVVRKALPRKQKYRGERVVYSSSVRVAQVMESEPVRPQKIAQKATNKSVETEEMSTDKPDSSTNKSIPAGEVSTNKKKLPPLKRREFLGGKSQTNE